MAMQCTRCGSTGSDAARFCGQCGLSLETGVDGLRSAGHVRDPRPESTPPGFVPIERAANLSFRWESSLGGGAPLGAEAVVVRIHNAGYPLRDVVVEVACEGRDHAPHGRFEEMLRELPRGHVAAFEVPSHRLDGEVRFLRLRLVSADFQVTS